MCLLFWIVYSFVLEKLLKMVYTGRILFGSDDMTGFRSKMNRFFFRNRDKGIKNLMLYIAVSNVIVYGLSAISSGTSFFYELLRFDYDKLFSGEVWRLFTFMFCYLSEMSRPLLGLISLFFYYWCGTVLEQSWGTLRCNLFYLSGVVLTDLAAIVIGIVAKAELGVFGTMIASGISANYINMSLLLAVATLLPDQLIHIYFVIPVKMKWLAWLDIGFTAFSMIRWIAQIIQVRYFYVSLFLVLLIPLVAIVNYLIFFGKGAAAILPDSLRYHSTRKSWKRKLAQGNISPDAGTVRHAGNARGGSARFRCTVCGRTELSHPSLEFRYCSKCAGYRCYCEEHIQNHTHITE